MALPLLFWTWWKSSYGIYRGVEESKVPSWENPRCGKGGVWRRGSSRGWVCWVGLRWKIWNSCVAWALHRCWCHPSAISRTPPSPPPHTARKSNDPGNAHARRQCTAPCTPPLTRSNSTSPPSPPSTPSPYRTLPLTQITTTSKNKKQPNGPNLIYLIKLRTESNHNNLECAPPYVVSFQSVNTQ